MEPPSVLPTLWAGVPLQRQSLSVLFHLERDLGRHPLQRAWGGSWERGWHAPGSGPFKGAGRGSGVGVRFPRPTNHTGSRRLRRHPRHCVLLDPDPAQRFTVPDPSRTAAAAPARPLGEPGAQAGPGLRAGDAALLRRGNRAATRHVSGKGRLGSGCVLGTPGLWQKGLWRGPPCPPTFRAPPSSLVQPGGVDKPNCPPGAGVSIYRCAPASNTSETRNSTEWGSVQSCRLDWTRISELDHLSCTIWTH